MRQGETNFFKPYFDILPENFDENPTMFGEREIKMLEGSDDLIAQIQER